jgi:hypothetical protein
MIQSRSNELVREGVILRMDETKEMTFHLKKKKRIRGGENMTICILLTYRDVDARFARFFHHPTIVVAAVLGTAWGPSVQSPHLGELRR